MFRDTLSKDITDLDEIINIQNKNISSNKNFDCNKNPKQNVNNPKTEVSSKNVSTSPVAKLDKSTSFEGRTNHQEFINKTSILTGINNSSASIKDNMFSELLDKYYFRKSLTFDEFLSGETNLETSEIINKVPSGSNEYLQKVAKSQYGLKVSSFHLLQSTDKLNDSEHKKDDLDSKSLQLLKQKEHSFFSSSSTKKVISENFTHRTSLSKSRSQNQSDACKPNDHEISHHHLPQGSGILNNNSLHECLSSSTKGKRSSDKHNSCQSKSSLGDKIFTASCQSSIKEETINNDNKSIGSKSLVRFNGKKDLNDLSKSSVKINNKKIFTTSSNNSVNKDNTKQENKASISKLSKNLTNQKDLNNLSTSFLGKLHCQKGSSTSCKISTNKEVLNKKSKVPGSSSFQMKKGQVDHKSQLKTSSRKIKCKNVITSSLNGKIKSRSSSICSLDYSEGLKDQQKVNDSSKRFSEAVNCEKVPSNSSHSFKKENSKNKSDNNNNLNLLNKLIGQQDSKSSLGTTNLNKVHTTCSKSSFKRDLVNKNSSTCSINSGRWLTSQQNLNNLSKRSLKTTNCKNTFSNSSQNLIKEDSIKAVVDDCNSNLSKNSTSRQGLNNLTDNSLGNLKCKKVFSSTSRSSIKEEFINKNGQLCNLNTFEINKDLNNNSKSSLGTIGCKKILSNPHSFVTENDENKSCNNCNSNVSESLLGQQYLNNISKISLDTINCKKVLTSSSRSSTKDNLINKDRSNSRINSSQKLTSLQGIKKLSKKSLNTTNCKNTCPSSSQSSIKEEIVINGSKSCSLNLSNKLTCKQDVKNILNKKSSTSCVLFDLNNLKPHSQVKSENFFQTKESTKNSDVPRYRSQESVCSSKHSFSILNEQKCCTVPCSNICQISTKTCSNKSNSVLVNNKTEAKLNSIQNDISKSMMFDKPEDSLQGCKDFLKASEADKVNKALGDNRLSELEVAKVHCENNEVLSLDKNYRVKEKRSSVSSELGDKTVNEKSVVADSFKELVCIFIDFVFYI